MGFRISWLAAKGMARKDLLDHFGLAATEERDEANEAPFSVAELPTGWTVLWANNQSFANAARCQALSAKTPVIACRINETVMTSATDFFEGGEHKWSVSHNAQRGRYDLQRRGDLPQAYAAIRADLTFEQDEEGGDQADVDLIFDIPIELARSVCGFKHDSCEFDWGEPEFFACLDPDGLLQPEGPSLRGLLSALFGR